jgi:serine/threonine protein phosphatase PrpC
MDELLSIGEFSRRSAISAKRLRAYADAGVLPPAAVDADNGYRYYAPWQLDRARAIDLLRTAGISIASIREFLHRPSKETLAAWLRQVDEEAARRRTALHELRALLVLESSPFTETRDSTPAPGGNMFTFTAAARSEQGRSRKANQDLALVDHGFAAVADGMGGGPAGERAAAIAVAELHRAATTERAVVEGIRSANRRIWEEAQADDALDGMGTTAVAATLDRNGSITVANVGDSRTYLLRSGSLRQLTIDDNVVSELVRRGDLTPAAASTHPHRHVLTKALGVAPEIEPTVVELAPEDGDRLLLCTDGVTNELDDDCLREALAGSSLPADAISAIFDELEESDRSDDATAVVIDVRMARR